MQHEVIQHDGYPTVDGYPPVFILGDPNFRASTAVTQGTYVSEMQVCV